MDAVIFIGLQGAGKSTFYQRQFADTHLRINLDMLRTRHRERRLFELCLAIEQPFVIDNTNASQAEAGALPRPAPRPADPRHRLLFRIEGHTLPGAE